MTDQQEGARHQGSCLCGAVQFEVDGDFDSFFLCHCQRCRKGSGSAHAANLFSAKGALRWLCGEDKTRLFTVPSTRHIRCFCSICGAALPNKNGSLLVVPAGSLNSDVSIRPNAHIFVASRANWDDALEQVPRVDGFPKKS